MTDELWQETQALIQKFCDLKQVAFFVVLEPIVTGQELVAPCFCSTVDYEKTQDVIAQLAKSGMKLVVKFNDQNRIS